MSEYTQTKFTFGTVLRFLVRHLKKPQSIAFAFPKYATICGLILPTSKLTLDGTQQKNNLTFRCYFLNAKC